MEALTDVGDERKYCLPAAENMTDGEVQFGIQLENSPLGQTVLGGQLREDKTSWMESRIKQSLQIFRQRGVHNEPLSMLADVALAPFCGDLDACSCVEDGEMERSLQSMQLQLQRFMHKADDLHDCLVNGQGHLEREALGAAVPSFLYTCQPYFNHLESTVRGRRAQQTPLPFNIYTKLLDFSEQLCDRLEQLVLTYASYNLLCLDEAEPNSMSHFCIGQIQLGQMRLTTFRYCRPTPYLSQVDTGLYKRMRWNVERFRDEQQTDQELGGNSKKSKAENIEYYFLCYEDIPNAHAEANMGSQDVRCGRMLRMWSIGQWLQQNPDPNTDDIYDWIMCGVPQASYHKLLFLGSEEPSSRSATDCLQQLLMSQETTD